MQSDGFWHRHHETADSEEPSLECNRVSSKGLLHESSSRFSLRLSRSASAFFSADRTAAASSSTMVKVQLGFPEQRRESENS